MMTLFVYSPMFGVCSSAGWVTVLQANASCCCKLCFIPAYSDRASSPPAPPCCRYLLIHSIAKIVCSSLTGRIFLLKTNDRWKTVNQILWKYAICAPMPLNTKFGEIQAFYLTMLCLNQWWTLNPRLAVIHFDYGLTSSLLSIQWRSQVSASSCAQSWEESYAKPSQREISNCARLWEWRGEQPGVILRQLSLAQPSALKA